jgi:hypothetical protein
MTGRPEVSGNTEYLLNITHADGAPKARFFLSQGCTKDNPGRLAEALIQHFENCPNLKITTTEWGIKYVAEGQIDTPNGRRVNIRSVWTHPKGSIAGPFLVTAYPQDATPTK